jgi:hypothetical protein
VPDKANEELMSKNTCQPIRTVPVYFLTLISKILFHALFNRNWFKLQDKTIIVAKKKDLNAPGVVGFPWTGKGRKDLVAVTLSQTAIGFDSRIRISEGPGSG